MKNLIMTFIFINILMIIPAIAYASPDSGGIGSGRLLPSIAALGGFVGIIIGKRALNRVRRKANGTTGATVAAALGLISVSIGGLNAANAAGCFGTGNGLAGAISARELGLVSIGLAIFYYLIAGRHRQKQ